MKRMMILLCGLCLLLAVLPASGLAEEGKWDTLLSGREAFLLSDSEGETLREAFLPQDQKWAFWGEEEWLCQMERFVLMDIDRDGEEELVLEITQSADGASYLTGYLVLDRQEDAVYGYEFYIRTMNELKADGAFLYSGGAFDNGCAHIRLDKGAYELLPYTYCQWDDAAEAELYFVKGEPADENQFGRAMAVEDAKPAPAWQAL